MAYSDAQKAEILRLRDEGKSLREIEATIKTDRGTLSRFLRSQGRSTKEIRKDRTEEVIVAYARTSSVNQVSKELGMHRDTVRKILDGHSKGQNIVDPDAGINPAEVAQKRRFVVTSALNNCPVHQEFLQSLLKYCEVNNAQLLVIPVRYKNVSLYNTPGEYEVEWPAELEPYYVTGDVELSSNIVIMGSMRIQATASRPLRALPGVSKGRSAVFGHPRVALEMVPTPLTRIPMVYFTTGSVSQPAYSETKAGRLGEFHHSIAAAIVETDGDYFWWRHVHSNPNGTFTDFETKYTPNGPERAPAAEAIIMGDVHIGFDDTAVVDAVLCDLLPKSEAKNVILHDILDFFSASHHHTNNRVLQVLKEARGRNSVYDELQMVADWLHNYTQGGNKFHIIRSNHHDHLERWLNNNSATIDAKNMWLWHHLNAAQMKEALDLADQDPAGDQWHVTSAFELAIRALADPDTNERIRFHDDRQPLEFKGIDVSNHGDRGPNGARGSRGAFAQVQRRTFIGHSHQPGITDGCYQVGMSCRPDMPYMSGYSGWLPTSGIIYADGHRTLFPIINGKCRLGGA
jgi:lambda repressor-like predicted transcriptional regulator